MTRSQHSTPPPIDDPRGVVDPDLVDACRKLSTIKQNYEAKRLDYLLDKLLPFFNAWRVTDGLEPVPPSNRPPVTDEEMAAAWEDYKALEEWKAELEAACNEEPQPEKQHKPRTPTLADVAKLAKEPGVARVERRPDGTVVVVTGQGEQQQGNELDEWIAKHARAPERH